MGSLVVRILAIASACLLLPAIYGCLAITAALRQIATPRRRAIDPLPQAMSASIIVLNWNGKDIIIRCLDSIRAALDRDGGDHEVIVVDNGSTDGSQELITRTHPRVRLIALTENLGFGEGNNAGVRAAKNPIVLLLNNDMVVEPDFLRPLLEPLRDPAVFATSAQIHFLDPSKRRDETGKTLASWGRRGVVFAHGQVDDPVDRARIRPCLWAGGGSSAYRRDLFLGLGGFDPMFSPAYYEDTDISYRAWKRGYASVFVARSVVHHEHRASTSRRFTSSELAALVDRNQILWLWTNLDSFSMLLAASRFPIVATLRLAWKQPGVLGDLIRRCPRLLQRRIQEIGAIALADEEVWRRSHAAFLRQEEARREPLGLLVMTPYLPRRGANAGTARVHRLLAGLRARGHRISLIAVCDSAAPAARIESEEVCDDLSVVDSPDPLSALHLVPRVEAERFPRGLRAALDARRMRTFDVALLEFTGMAGAVRWVRGIPTILTAHEVLSRARRMTYEATPRGWARIGALVRWILAVRYESMYVPRFEKVVCLTREDAGELRALAPKVSVDIVPMGVDPPPDVEREERSVDATGGTVLFVGAYRHAPNVDAATWLATAIIPLVRQSRPHLKLYIVGTHPPPEIEALAGLHPGNVITGALPDLGPVHDSADVFVAPIRLGGGMRGKVLDAWVRGVPVVATPLACEGISIEPEKNVMLGRTAAEIASGIERVLGDAELRASLSTAGRHAALTRYSWDAAVDALERTIREVAAGSSAESRA